jgi:hypothetical protein
VTEKLDGTSAQIYIDKIENAEGVEEVIFKVGSRNRWLTPESDNFGFAKWAYENKEELLKLGVGRHYGEWWGNGIQRGYGLPKGYKRFSLFNVQRWSGSIERPSCCSVVPILYQGEFSEKEIQQCLWDLKINGSKVAPFLDPEGIVVYHKQGNLSFKITLDGDGHKCQNEA